MQTSQSFGIHFTTRADKAKDGKEPIYACVTVNRQRAYIALKQNVDPKNWDSGKGAAKGNKEEVKAINNYLQEVRIAIGNSYKELQLKRKMYPQKLLRIFIWEPNKTFMRLAVFLSTITRLPPKTLSGAARKKAVT